MAESAPNPSASPPSSIARAVTTAALFLCGCCLLLSGWLAVYAFSPGPASADKSAIVTIARGTPLREMSKVLAGVGLVEEDIRFAVVARILGYSGRIRAGEFELATGMTPLQLLRQLITARPVQHAVTIPEGLRLDEIGQIFAQGKWCDAERFSQLAHDKAFLTAIGFGGLDSLEGYLFPDTYYLTRDVKGAEELITMMTRRFREVWAQLAPSPVEQKKQHEVVTLASIVEKETGRGEERPVIAGVFANRLKIGMRLQSDPTVIYGIDDFSGNITRKHLQTPSRYNTYTLSGLPAGPISNPGRSALEAALHPAVTDYFYFVGRNDGTHQFSRTLEEHTRAVLKYQRKKPEKNGKG